MGSSVEKQRDGGRRRSLLREVNERIVGIANGETTEVLCECGTGKCTETFLLHLEDYKAIREVPDRFLIVSSHLQPDVERVIEDRGSFVIVGKGR